MMIAVEEGIRIATKEDVPEVAQLWVQMVEELAPEFSPRVDWWEEMACNLLDGGIYEIVLYLMEDKIAGFMDYFIFPEPSTGKIHGVGQHLFILPEHRKSHVIRKLYKTAIKGAISRGAESLEFMCFMADLKKWEKKGYSPARVMMRREVGYV